VPRQRSTRVVPLPRLNQSSRANYRPRAIEGILGSVNLARSSRGSYVIPIRSCIACRAREQWTNLLHVVLVAGAALADPEHRLPGRGAWIHIECFDMAKNRRSFERAFRVKTEVHLTNVEEYIRSRTERIPQKEY